MAIADKGWKVVDAKPAWEAESRSKPKAEATGKAGTPLTLALQLTSPMGLEEMLATMIEQQGQMIERMAATEAAIQQLSATITQSHETSGKQMTSHAETTNKAMDAKLSAIEKAVTAPRVITLERGKDGLAKSATSRIGK